MNALIFEPKISQQFLYFRGQGDDDIADTGT